ncbi:MAG: hypothetical protein U1E65_03200 [Myxococcota bacterium]
MFPRPVFLGGLALALASACTSREILRADLTHVDLELAAAVVVDGAEVPTRVSSMFSVRGGALSTGSFPSFQLRPGEETVRIVSASFRDIQASSRLFSEVPREGLSFGIGIPPSTVVATEPGDYLALRAPFLASTAVYGLGDGGQISDVPGEVLKGLVVQGASRRDDLRSGQQLLPFAAEDRIFAPGVVLPGSPERTPSFRILQILPISPDRLVVVTSNALMLVERGHPLDLVHTSSSASTFLSISALESEPSARITDATMRDGEIIVVGEVDIPHDGLSSEGRIWRFQLVQDGLLSPVGQAEVLGDRPGALNAAAFDAAGGVVVAGEQGRLYYSDASDPQRRFRSLTRLRTETAYADLLFLSTNVFADIDVIIPEGSAVLLAASNGKVLRGDPADDTWRLALDAAPLATTQHSARINGIAARDGETWAVTRTGAIVHADTAGNAALLNPLPPPALEPCVPHFSGEVALGVLQSVAVDATHLYATSKGCSAVFRVRRSDDLLTALAPFGEVRVRESGDDYQRVWITPNGALLVAGDLGRLYELLP